MQRTTRTILAVTAGVLMLAAPAPGGACPGDCGDGDGQVGIADLLGLLAQWGTPGACDINATGVVDISDLLEILFAWGPCPPDFCGPGSGACCTANSTPGCADASCCTLVCQIDPYCCDTEWDATCAGAAQSACNCTSATCVPGAGSCCVANGTPGCENVSCCATICASDPYCCLEEWDGACAAAAQAACDCPKGTCGPGYGNCCVANGTPGCEDAGCCTAICAIDPFCCDVEWDGLCAGAAAASPECGCP